MNVMKNFLAAMFLTAAMLFPSASQAMGITQFDRMALEDQSDYITLLVDGAQKVLIDEGKNDLAAKVHKLFTEIPTGDNASLGLTEFESNLDRARLADIRNLEKDPHALRIEVEDAMAVTLEANKIELPDSFFSVGKNFKPKHPPKDQK